MTTPTCLCSNPNVVESSALDKTYWYCRGCKSEVTGVVGADSPVGINPFYQDYGWLHNRPLSSAPVTIPLAYPQPPQVPSKVTPFCSMCRVLLSPVTAKETRCRQNTMVGGHSWETPAGAPTPEGLNNIVLCFTCGSPTIGRKYVAAPFKDFVSYTCIDLACSATHMRACDASSAV